MDARVSGGPPDLVPQRAKPAEPGRARLARFYVLHAGLPLALAGLLLVVFETTRLDRALSDLFYDPALRRFPLRSHWFFQLVMHDLAKYAIIAFAAGVLALFAGSLFRARLRPWRRPAVYVLLCLGIGPATVGWLKDSSPRHCPWDLEIYGGYAPYTPLTEAPPPGIKPGKCFPGGHSSGGFALMSTYLALRLRWPRLARIGLAVGFAYGFALGFGRIVQGAHFLSHNLASALVCWSVSLVLYELLLRRGEERRRGRR